MPDDPQRGHAAPDAAHGAPGADRVPGGIIDDRRLDQLRSVCGGSTAIFVQLVADHCDNAGALCEAIRASFARRDADHLHRAAHSLKASSAMFGAVEVSALAARVEELSDGAISSGAADAIERLGAVFARTYPELRRAARSR